jgi:hypothetical protein
MNGRRVGGAFLAFAVFQASAATDPLASGLLKCAAESEQAARLACFDALVTTIPKVKADEFGMTADVARKREPGVSAHDDFALPGKIVSLQLAQRGEIVFTLDNHQVWMQIEIEPSKKFSLGESVHIEQGAMGSFWLAADKSRKTKVKRIS